MFENSNYHTLTIYILVITAIIGPLAAGAEKNRDFDCNFDIFPLEKRILETQNQKKIRLRRASFRGWCAIEGTR